MSLQGSIHKWSDGIGYGAFIPTERAYYNVRERRPSHDTTREYRRHNVTAGIDTQRSDISFGKTNESVRGGTDGHSRAREATKSLTSGEVRPRSHEVSRCDVYAFRTEAISKWTKCTGISESSWIQIAHGWSSPYALRTALHSVSTTFDLCRK